MHIPLKSIIQHEPSVLDQISLNRVHATMRILRKVVQKMKKRMRLKLCLLSKILFVSLSCLNHLGLFSFTFKSNYINCLFCFETTNFSTNSSWNPVENLRELCRIPRRRFVSKYATVHMFSVCPWHPLSSLEVSRKVLSGWQTGAPPIDRGRNSTSHDGVIQEPFYLTPCLLISNNVKFEWRA